MRSAFFFFDSMAVPVTPTQGGEGKKEGKKGQNP
jgi:hypothetical protein